MNLERMYTVIIGPHVSEKTTLMGENDNQYAFRVAKNATKLEIKEA
ncbi:MAG: 50S ribosomal protein L23, partial [Pseudomonadota bacterium]|nr:50S ribosomal protein L23 [Pseudomonadota bacterium]